MTKDPQIAASIQEFPAGALVALCLLLEERCWRYYDAARQEWVSYDFTVQLASLGWLPKAQFPEGDPLAGSQAGSNGPSGSPNSPSGALFTAAKRPFTGNGGTSRWFTFKCRRCERVFACDHGFTLLCSECARI